MTKAMSRAEIEDLQRLVRQREKVLKSAAKQRSAELLADFENQMGQEYSFDQDETWDAAYKAADREVAKAQAQVAARCRELGIPGRFAPEVDVHWRVRGYDNLITKRKDELRRMATTRIDAIERQAITQIELQCLAAQEKLATASVTSEAAGSFIASLPGIDTLMPKLSFEEIAGPADPPVAEQLVSSNALRQRRYRDRHRNAPALHRNAEQPATALPLDADPAQD